MEPASSPRLIVTEATDTSSKNTQSVRHSPRSLQTGSTLSLPPVSAELLEMLALPKNWSEQLRKADYAEYSFKDCIAEYGVKNEIINIFQKCFPKAALKELTNFLRSQDCTPKSIILNDCDLTGEVAKKIFPAIANSFTITALQIKKCSFNDDICLELLNTLHLNPEKIRTLELNEVLLTNNALFSLINELNGHNNFTLRLNKCIIKDQAETSLTFRKGLIECEPNISTAFECVNELPLSADQEEQCAGFPTAIDSRNAVTRTCKCTDMSFTGVELAALIKLLIQGKGSRLLLENCHVHYKDKQGVAEFNRILASTNNEKSNSPIILEVVNLRTDQPFSTVKGRRSFSELCNPPSQEKMALPIISEESESGPCDANIVVGQTANGFLAFIEGIMTANISTLHLQGCNFTRASRAIMEGLMSGYCKIQTLQIVDDQCNLTSLRDVVKGLLAQNNFKEGVTTLTIASSGLNSTFSRLLEELILNSKKLRIINFPNNNLGSDSVFSHRRYSDGFIHPITRAPDIHVETSSEKEIEKRSPIAALVNALKFNTTLELLNLSSNQLSVKEVLELKGLLTFNAIVTVDIRGNEAQHKTDKQEIAENLDIPINNEIPIDSDTLQANGKRLITGTSPRTFAIPKEPELNTSRLIATPRTNDMPILISPRKVNPENSERSPRKIKATKRPSTRRTSAPPLPINLPAMVKAKKPEGPMSL